MSVFRASSLAAVTSLVWSTKVKPSFAASSRICRRTSTMSGSDRTGSCSLETTAIPLFHPVHRPAQQLHASFHVQCCPHTAQRESQFHLGYRHRRLHSHHDRLRV